MLNIDYNKLPEEMRNEICELDKLIKKYPKKIPTDEAAKYLGMDKSCLRRVIEQGKAPFALGCDNGEYGNRYSYVSTLTFYLWCLSPVLKTLLIGMISVLLLAINH